MAFWLSEPVESLLEANAANPGSASCHALIVGSGYGGAIAAMRLAHPDRKVIVFERGKEYALGDFPENLGELPGYVRLQRASDPQPLGYANALFDLRVSDKVAALVGNGLGGGSLINANVALKPDAAAFSHSDWPEGIRNDAGKILQTMDHVGKWLGVVCDDERPGKLIALDRLAKALGATCEAAPVTVSFKGGRNVVGVEQAPCVRCGNCVTGCNVGAKNTLAMNLLPLAKARGARIYTGATVISVEPAGEPKDERAGGAGWIVRFRRTATEKSPLRDEVHTIHASVVVLAAGTLGSTEILLRSRARRKIQCSALLGKRFSTNGDTIALGYAQRSAVGAVARTGSLDPAKKEVGPTINGYATVTIPAKGNVPEQRFVLEDGAVPVSLARVFAELAVSGSLIKRYLDLKEPAWFDANRDKDSLAVHPQALQHSQLLLGMGDDGAAGELRLKVDSGEVDATNADLARLAILWPAGEGSKASQFLQAMDERLREVEEKGFDGGDYLQNPAWRPLPKAFAAELTGEAPEGPLLTVHPLGGCPMGNDVHTGVVNQFGQVFRLQRGRRREQDPVYAGLYVMDGAVIPRPLGVNPFLTIAALAWRASSELLQSRGWPESGIAQVGLENPACSRRQVVTQPERVSARILERLVGTLSPRPPEWFRAAAKHRLPERNWLALEISIEFADLDQWLANPDAALPALCTLGANKADTDEFKPENVIPIAQIQGSVKVLARDGPRDDAQLRRRAVAALSTYGQRHGLPSGSKTGASGWEQGLWRTACNHAHWRVLEYLFQFNLPGTTDRWVLKGTKRLAYSAGEPNVWSALVELPVELAPENAGLHGERYPGVLKVDLVDLSRNALIRVREAVHTPAALMTVIGMGMLALRVLFRTHFWSFGAPDYSERRPSGNRDPEPIRTQNHVDVKPIRVPLLVPAGNEGEEPLALNLWRYPHPTVAREDKILLIHGLAHGPNVFTTRTIDRPLAAYLYDEGYEVWLLEHRLSPALEKASRRQSTMDEIARYDIPEAVRYVYREAEAPIRVFAHCIGAGCFSMAVLAGHCKDKSRNRTMIRSAAIHAVPPWVVPSKMNQLRANLAAFVKDVIGEYVFDPIPPDRRNSSFLETLLDRLAGSLPWPESDLKRHNHDRKHDLMGRAICNRMTMFYGTEWVHENLSESTHTNLAQLVGVGNIEVFRQIFFIAQRERLTDREGRNRYLTDRNIKANWLFPTLFAHGAQNQVFSPESSRRSAVRLRIAQQTEGFPGQEVHLAEIPGYGHMDFLFGEHACRDVYPSIGDFFCDDLKRRRPALAADQHERRARSTATGPIIGHAYRDTDRTPKLRVWVEARDDVTTAPRTVEFHARFGDDTWQPLRSAGERFPGRYERHWYVVSDVEVPAGATEIKVTVHYFRPEDWLKTAPKGNEGISRNRSFPVGNERGERSSAEPASDSRINVSFPWFRRLTGSESGSGCTFLAGSCRHPGSPFEREASDRIFGAMAKQVAAGADHVLLLGDQIYSDATADVFDTDEPGERYGGRYREAYRSHYARQLLSSVPVYMALDDHEFGDNWEGMSCRSGAPVRERAEDDREDLFRVALDAARVYERAMGPGTRPWDTDEPFWYEFNGADDVPFFVMDTRSERCLRTCRDMPQDARMVHDEQMNALEQWLKRQHDSTMPKFIVCSTPIGPVPTDLATRPSLWRNSDWWFGYPNTLARLVRLMVGFESRNVVFISGDYHYSAIADLVFYGEDGKFGEAKQIIASGLFAPMPFANERPEDFRFGEWVAMPVLGTSMSVGVKAKLLAPGIRSHFLRVEASRQSDSMCSVTATVIFADGAQGKPEKVC